jgi:molybdate transport system regulatory protein
MSKKEKARTQIRPRLRITSGKDIALGPGKVELLEAVQQAGSISKAAKGMGMSYMRAWTLIRTMNHSFREPLVATVRGAVKGGGGAHLTKTGREVLMLYQQISSKFVGAIQPEWRQLQRLLRS